MERGGHVAAEAGGRVCVCAQAGGGGAWAAALELATPVIGAERRVGGVGRHAV